MRVELTYQEMMMCAVVGTLRQTDNMKNNVPHWGVLASSEIFAFDNHIIAAMAEYAVSKTFNLHWSLEERFGHDVGGLIEVRYRRKESGPDLGIRNNDKPGRPYLLVHGEPPVFYLVGWILGRDGWAVGEPNRSNPNLHFVAASALRPVPELLTILPPRRPG
jgi:hypothetical protein